MAELRDLTFGLKLDGKDAAETMSHFQSTAAKAEASMAKLSINALKNKAAINNMAVKSVLEIKNLTASTRGAGESLADIGSQAQAAEDAIGRMTTHTAADSRRVESAAKQAGNAVSGIAEGADSASTFLFVGIKLELTNLGKEADATKAKVESVDDVTTPASAALVDRVNNVNEEAKKVDVTAATNKLNAVDVISETADASVGERIEADNAAANNGVNVTAATNKLNAVDVISETADESVGKRIEADNTAANNGVNVTDATKALEAVDVIGKTADASVGERIKADNTAASNAVDVSAATKKLNAVDDISEVADDSVGKRIAADNAAANTGVNVTTATEALEGVDTVTVSVSAAFGSRVESINGEVDSIAEGANGAKGAIEGIDDGAKEPTTALETLADKFITLAAVKKVADAIGQYFSEALDAVKNVEAINSQFQALFSDESQAKAWAEEYASQLNQSVSQIQELMIGFDTFLRGKEVDPETAAEAAKQLTTIAEDIAAETGRPVEEVQKAIEDALNGNKEALIGLGADVSAANDLISMERLGLKGAFEDLSEMEQLWVRYQTILDQSMYLTGTAVEVANRDSQTLTEAQTKLDSATLQVKEAFGAIFAESTMAVIDKLADALLGIADFLNKFTAEDNKKTETYLNPEASHIDKAIAFTTMDTTPQEGDSAQTEAVKANKADFAPNKLLFSLFSSLLHGTSMKDEYAKGDAAIQERKDVSARDLIQASMEGEDVKLKALGVTIDDVKTYAGSVGESLSDISPEAIAASDELAGLAKIVGELRTGMDGFHPYAWGAGAYNGWEGVDFENAPRNASGTPNFEGGWTRMNERGGELAYLPGGSAILPADKTDKVLGGGPVSFNTTIIIQGNPDQNTIDSMLKQQKEQFEKWMRESNNRTNGLRAVKHAFA
ncbi:MAG: hypothetical protein LBK46_03790 [Oscillospiraceae bacterium]|jgi:hypothetical protein|nr:hypothetical protein [Oscillospiraceae bacterium]